MVTIQTVLGPIAPEEFGLALVHEHIMCDFIGAAQTGPHRWDRAEIVQTMLPYLQALRQRGVTGFVDCTPMYLGRDPRVLADLSARSGLHILTNTGLYKEPYLPSEVFGLGPQELATRWVREFQEGIEDTGIRPGFVKIAVNPGPLVPIQQIIVRAAARTHLATGLTVACHTGHGVAAAMSLDLVEAEGMNPSRFVIVHADQIAELDVHCQLAARGAWLEYDSIGTRPIDEHVRLVSHMLGRGYEDQILLSQDAGWYSVGEPGGGKIRPFTTLFDEFIPRLKEIGIGDELVHKLFVLNPRRAFTIQAAS